MTAPECPAWCVLGPHAPTEVDPFGYVHESEGVEIRAYPHDIRVVAFQDPESGKVGVGVGGDGLTPADARAMAHHLARLANVAES